MNIERYELLSLQIENDLFFKYVKISIINGIAFWMCENYLISWIGGVYGFSTLIVSKNECRFSQSGVPVFANSKHKSGISLISCTPN